MAHVIITKETRKRLLLAASSGQSVAALEFILTRWDSEFQAELIGVAENAKNTLFFQGLDRFLAGQKRDYRRSAHSLPKPKKTTSKRKLTPKPKTTPMLSPNYDPAGIGFREFLEQRGLYYPPQ